MLTHIDISNIGTPAGVIPEEVVQRSEYLLSNLKVPASISIRSDLRPIRSPSDPISGLFDL